MKTFFLKVYRKLLKSKYKFNENPDLPLPLVRFLLSRKPSIPFAFEWSEGCLSTAFLATIADNFYSAGITIMSYPHPKIRRVTSDDRLQTLLKICSLEKKFDLISVDGDQKYDCAKIALQFLSDRGFILLNNSVQYPNLCQLLKTSGFQQFNFKGHSLHSLKTSTASIFAKDLSHLDLRIENSAQLSFLPAIEDDKSISERDFAKPSFSQEGEDIILSEIFTESISGFYVDVGAHHPFRFSNTYALYQKGWMGLNIDPNHHIETAFRQLRPRDQFWHGAISDCSGKGSYYEFDESALNTLSEVRAKEIESKTHFRLSRISEIQVETLNNVLKSHSVPKNLEVLNIDVESHEMQVLSGLDFSEFRPRFILIESLMHNMTEIHEDPIFLKLQSVGYRLRYALPRTLFFEILK